MWFEQLLVRLLNSLAKKPQAKPTPGLVLGHRTDGPEHGLSVVWPETRLCEHSVVVGRTGSGKTHKLQFDALQHMQQGRGFLFLDFHADATAQLTALASLHPDAAERLIIFDPTDATTSPGINPLELSGNDYREAFPRTSEVTSILRQRWKVDSFGARSEELLRAVLFTASVHNLTLVDIPLILTSTPVRQRLTANLPSPDIKAYWQDRFEPLSEAMKGVFREPLLNKLTAFIVDPSVRHVLGQRRSTIDFAEAMREGRWVVINLSRGTIGEHAHTLGNLLMAKLQFDIFARARIPPSQRRVFAVICDEVQNLQENDIATLVTESRKYGCSLTTACQSWDLIPTHLRAALLTAGTHVFFRLSAADAGTLASELSPAARTRYVNELTNLQRGHAIVRVGSDPPATIRVPPLPKLPTDTHERVRLLTSRSRRIYARGRNAIETDILERQRALTHAPHPTINPTTHDHQTNEGQGEW